MESVLEVNHLTCGYQTQPVFSNVNLTLLSNHFGYMMLISGGLGSVISFAGIYLSYYFDVASGASIVLLSTLVFGGVLVWTNYRRRSKRLSAPLNSNHL